MDSIGDVTNDTRIDRAVNPRRAERDKEVIGPLAAKRIKQRAREVSASESAGVSVVVNARHDETHHEERDGVSHRFRSNHRAPAAASVVDERTEKPEDRRRRTDVVGARREERDRESAEKQSRQTAQSKSHDAGDTYK